MFTTSYKSEGLEDLLTALIRSVGPSKVVEFGTQQGHSAVLIAKGMDKGYVKTYDLFEKNYSQQPFKATHAELLTALKNTKEYDIRVYRRDVLRVRPVECDVLHIDICNHYDNVKPLLESWSSKVKTMIILEGGVENKWQKKYGFNPFNSLLYQLKEWNHVVIRGKKGYAMTILTRK